MAAATARCFTVSSPILSSKSVEYPDSLPVHLPESCNCAGSGYHPLPHFTQEPVGTIGLCVSQKAALIFTDSNNFIIVGKHSLSLRREGNILPSRNL